MDIDTLKLIDYKKCSASCTTMQIISLHLQNEGAASKKPNYSLRTSLGAGSRTEVWLLG